MGVSYQRKLVEFPAGEPGLGWWSDARCRGDSSFDWLGLPNGHPDKRRRSAMSKFCGACPVREDCLQDALFEGTDSAGVRGGLSAPSRRSMLSAHVNGDFSKITTILENAGWSPTDAANIVDAMKDSSRTLWEATDD